MEKLDRVGSAFIRAIVTRMKALGLNHSSLARRMKISRPYVVKVLRGDVNITLAAAARFAQALETDFIPALVPKEKTDATGGTASALESTAGDKCG